MKSTETTNKIISCIDAIHNTDFSLLSLHLDHRYENNYELKLYNTDTDTNDYVTRKIYDLTESLIDLIMTEDYIDIINFTSKNNIVLIYDKERKDSELKITFTITVNMTHSCKWDFTCTIGMKKIED